MERASPLFGTLIKNFRRVIRPGSTGGGGANRALAQKSAISPPPRISRALGAKLQKIEPLSYWLVLCILKVIDCIVLCIFSFSVFYFTPVVVTTS